ncbi:MAG: hypothetical protein CMJ62_10190 [Planctomycetaceae bacterium]|nr:hypothetical protein [Planctomycetaceae bacterium]
MKYLKIIRFCALSFALSPVETGSIIAEDAPVYSLPLRVTSVSTESPTCKSAELVEVRKIWDVADHNAFTDMIYWHEHFFLAFREGTVHAGSGDVGRVRILRSRDGESWKTATLIDSTSPQLNDLMGWDTREIHFSVTPDDRLMLVGMLYQDGAGGTFVAFADGPDPDDWKNVAPQKILDPPWWLWTTKWRGDTCWGFAYERLPNKDRTYVVHFMKSGNGSDWQRHVSNAINMGGQSSETAIRFDASGNGFALSRRNDISALLGKSSGDLKSWTWYDLGDDFKAFGGPNLIETSYGWIGGGRMHDAGANLSLTAIDVDDPKMHRILKLPSGGDCSYPGLVWHDNLLYVSYYSSHQGKASIYLAKVKLK